MRKGKEEIMHLVFLAAACASIALVAMICIFLFANGLPTIGKIVVAGSSSVTPAMEKLKEAYKKVNPEANIEVQQSDSTTGVKSAISGICDIGMASRGLKQSEKDAGVKATVIATDGIAVIVNKANKAENLTKAQVADIFMGKVTEWSKLAK